MKVMESCRTEKAVKTLTGVMKYISPEVRELLYGISLPERENIEEIRMRAGRPLMVCMNRMDRFVQHDGRLLGVPGKPVIITLKIISETLELFCRNSLYACQEDINRGFITTEGGHRVGIAGKAVLSGGSIKSIKEISGLNIRIAKEVTGCSKIAAAYIIDKESICNTLIVSPPQCGKTTMLRDLARALSNGDYKTGVDVGIVDERSEIAAVRSGIPQFNVGLRTDVLDACPKAEGMMMLIRSMSPDVIITDEIGNSGDADSIMKVLNAGVKIITSVHGYSVSEMKTRQEVQELIRRKTFDRYVVLSRNNGPGTLEEVYDGKNMKTLFRRDQNAS